MSEERIPVIFIAGFGRSGSTLLDLLLGQIDGVFSGGELLNVWDRVIRRDDCGCGEPFERCTLWARSLSAAGAGGSPEDAQRVLEAWSHLQPWAKPALARTPLPVYQEAPAALEAHGARMLALYRGMREVTGCDVIVDSSKRPGHGYALLTRPEIDVHVVHFVRDSRASVYSWTARKRWRNINWGAAKSAALWASGNAGALLLRGAASYRRIRYEDLVDDPRATLGRVLEPFPALSRDFPFLDGPFVPRTHHMLSGNPAVRTAATVEIRADDEWRTAMPRRDKLTATALTWPLLLAFGYPLRP